MTAIENTSLELNDADLDAVAGGLAVQTFGVCTGCTTIYLPTPWNPHPNQGGENPWLPGGSMR